MYRDARNEAGMSREEAAFRLHIGTRTLTNYEHGLTVVPPDVVLAMQEVYQAPTLTARYCAEYCPIGQVYANSVSARTLCQAVLGLMKEHTHVGQLRDRLIDIAEDGVIDESETDEFEQILVELLELEQQIEAIKLYAATIVNLPTLIGRIKEKTALRAAR